MSSPERVLITGGAGFIGSHLAPAWLERGAEVVILDDFSSGRRENLAGLDVEIMEGSVGDESAVRAAARGVDYVHHLAALVSVPLSMEQPRETEALNVGGTLNVLNAAREAGAKKFVLMSTCAVYGEADRPIHSEADLPEPASPYAITKLTGEYYCSLYSRAFGLPAVALRGFNVFGPRQNPESAYASAVAAFAARAAAGEPLRIHGDGEQTRDFVYVGDVVRANILAATGDATGVYNVSCGGRITVRELAETIIRLAGSDSRIEFTPPRAGDVKHSRGDASRLRELGWEPRVNLEEGLRRTLEWFQGTNR